MKGTLKYLIYFSAIPMPSQQYFLEVINDAIGELDQKTSVVTAKEQGFTEIVLKDKSKGYFLLLLVSS